MSGDFPQLWIYRHVNVSFNFIQSMYSEGSITAVVASEEDYPLNDDWACDMHSESMAAFVETRISTSDILSVNYTIELVNNLTTRALLLPMIDGFAFSLNNDKDVSISNWRRKIYDNFW